MLGAVKVGSDSLDNIINVMCEKYTVEPALAKAIIRQESSWDVNASRYEEHLNDSSWGLMQVLLKTARGVLNRPTLTIAELVTPEVNIEAGVKFIGQLLQRYNYTYDDAIAAYNAGSARRGKDGKYVNQSYVDGVNRWYNMYIAIGTVSNAASKVTDSIANAFSFSFTAPTEQSASQRDETDMTPFLVGGGALVAMLLVIGASKR